MTSVSVVVPTRNRRSYLIRALNSVEAQTTRVHEVVVIDDASDDGTIEALRNYHGSTDIRVLRNSVQAGANAARNRGIAEATGDWIAFLDSDDEWLPRKTELQLSKVVPSVGLVYGGAVEQWSYKRRRRQDTQHQGRVTHLLAAGWSPAIMSTVIVRRALLMRERFDESLLGFQDYDLWLRLSRLTEFRAVPDSVAVIHNHAHSRVSQQLAQRCRALEQVRAKWSEELLQSGYGPAFDEACRLWQWELGWARDSVEGAAAPNIRTWIREGIRNRVAWAAIVRRFFRFRFPFTVACLDALRSKLYAVLRPSRQLGS